MASRQETKTADLPRATTQKTNDEELRTQIVHGPLRDDAAAEPGQSPGASLDRGGRQYKRQWRRWRSGLQRCGQREHWPDFDLAFSRQVLPLRVLPARGHLYGCRRNQVQERRRGSDGQKPRRRRGAVPGPQDRGSHFGLGGTITESAKML